MGRRSTAPAAAQPDGADVGGARESNARAKRARKAPTSVAAAAAAAVVTGAPGSPQAAAAAVAGKKKKASKLAAPSPAIQASLAELQPKAAKIAQLLSKLYPNPPVPLDHGSHFQLLCAVLLSAQTTDVAVNKATPALFELAPDAAAMAALEMLVNLHGGEVPESFKELEALPGAFSHDAFPVDTHIHRLAQRWGLTPAGRSVEQTEADLKLVFPQHQWRDLHLQIIYLGRELCPAKGHDAAKCPICSWAAVPPFDRPGTSPSKANGKTTRVSGGASKPRKRADAAAAAAAAVEPGADAALAAPQQRDVDSLFAQELRRRGLSSVDDIPDVPSSSSGSGAGAGGGGARREPPRWASWASNTASEDRVPTQDQLEFSRKLNSEGLEGLIPRGALLLRLGLTSFLGFAPLVVATALASWALYAILGSSFIHSGSPAAGPPPYVDAELLLAEPTADPMIPFDSSTLRCASPLMGKGADEQVVEVLRDSQFAPFLDDDFDAASFASHALAGNRQTSAQQQLEQLQQGIAQLDAALRAEVLRRQDALIGGTARLGEAEAAVQRIALSVRSLQSVAARVRAEIAEPYSALSAKSRQLANLQATVDLLRHVIHRLKLVQRLRAQMAAEGGGVLELAKAARLLYDVAAVDEETDLSGIDAVEADREFLAATRVRVRAAAEAALQAGLDAPSQADVGSALQVLYNLGELRQAVDQQVDSSCAALGRELAAALDPRKLTAAGGAGPGGGPGGVKSLVSPLPGTTAKVQDVLWQRLGGAADLLARAALRTWHLQRVLLKKRDPLSHVLFVDVAAPGEEPLPLDRFWSKATTALADCFSAAFSTAHGGFALINSFPRLAGLLEEACTRLARDSAVRDAGHALRPDQAAVLLDAAADFQNAFLGSALARMTEAVGAAFPGGGRGLPGASELQKCVSRVHEELKAAGGGGPRLAALAAGAAGKALLLAAERAEYMAATGPDLRAVAGPCTAPQLRNLTLCNCLQEVHRGVSALLPRVPPAAAAALAPPLEALQATALELVAPTFQAIAEAAEAALLRMHEQHWGGGDAGGKAGGEAAGGAAAPLPEVVDTSPYMAQLARHLAHCRVEFLSKLSPSPTSPLPSVGRVLVERLAARLAVCAVRQACLLRPLGQAGKLQLAKDLAELEAALSQHLVPLEGLGRPARALRALRRLLFLDTPALAASPLLADVPPTAALGLLYARAPAALESPHARAGLTPAQYSLWLDEHSPEDAVAFVRKAFEACEKKAAGAPGAAEVLSLMRTLLARAGAGGAAAGSKGSGAS
eukprot:scaffold3.g6562.t1